jgi:lysozyme
MRPVPQVAVTFVADKEALRLKAYRDSRGRLTIGYGHTGPEVTVALTITRETAEAWLRKDLETAATRLAARIGSVVDDLTDNQYAALLSFTFNLGTGDPKKPEWSIWKTLRAKSFDQVPVQIMRFVYAVDAKTKKPVKIQGLVNRRAAEVALWSTDEPGSADESPPSSVTRAVETPPAPMGKPLAQSNSFIATAATVAATAPVAVKQVSDAIAPYADKSPAVAQMVAILATVAALLAVAALVFQWLKHRGEKR